MEEMIAAFAHLDADNNGQVSTLELEKYVKQKGLKPELVQTWKHIFDTNGDGIVTIDEFCEKLSLTIDEVHCKSEKVKAVKASKEEAVVAPLPAQATKPASAPAPAKLDPSVQMIATSMEPEQQTIVTNKAIELLKRRGDFVGSDEQAVTLAMKQWLDKEYGRLWHVVMMTGNFWMNYSHADKCSINFRVGKLILLIWRTPI